jgi:hypothetical protein
MNLTDYLVLGGIAAAVIYVAVWIANRKKQEKSGCGGCCPQKDCENMVCDSRVKESGHKQ